jgi:hypothetical protein
MKKDLVLLIVLIKPAIEEVKQLKREEQHRINKLTIKKHHPQKIKAKTNTDQSWLCWLLYPLLLVR